jgi:hypothetical protein
MRWSERVKNEFRESKKMFWKSVNKKNKPQEKLEVVVKDTKGEILNESEKVLLWESLNIFNTKYTLVMKYDTRTFVNPPTDTKLTYTLLRLESTHRIWMIRSKRLIRDVPFCALWCHRII